MYFICDKKGDKYGIKDTVDGKVEYYTESEIRDIVAKGINVRGVTCKTTSDYSRGSGGIRTVKWEFFVHDEKLFTTPESMLTWEDMENLCKPVKKALDSIISYWNFCGWSSVTKEIDIKQFGGGFIGYRKCTYISKTNSFSYRIYVTGGYNHISDSFEFDSFRIEILDRWDRLYEAYGSPVRASFTYNQSGVDEAGKWLQSLRIDNELPNAREHWNAWEKHVRSINNPIRKLFGNK